MFSDFVSITTILFKIRKGLLFYYLKLINVWPTKEESILHLHPQVIVQLYHIQADPYF